jgi:hypothetical protein
MTNNKQQTAVDSIIELCQKQMNNDSSIHKGVYLSIIKFCKEQAKEMEMEQKANTWNNAINAIEKDKWESFEQYYKETYGGGEQ